MEPPRVRPGLGKRAGAVDEFLDERRKLFFQPVPREAFIQSPRCGILPKLFLQVPGQSVILRPNSLHVSRLKTHRVNEPYFYPQRRWEPFSPLSLPVDAGADTQGAQLPAGKATLCRFGHKTKGAVVGLVLCKRVEILPLSLPVFSIRVSWRNTFIPVQRSRSKIPRSQKSGCNSRYSHLSLCIPRALY